MSITLTTGTNVVINGVTFENDTQGGCTDMNVNYNANTVTFTFRSGVASGTAIVPGAIPPTVTLTVNMTTGVWASFDSLNSLNNKAGTFSGAAFTTFVANMKTVRNNIESFVAGASGILPGTQVAWT
jgi:hypothetical protein